MTGEKPCGVLIPADTVAVLRKILARCQDWGEGVTDQDRANARLELVGAVRYVLGGERYRAPETRPGEQS